MNVYVIQINMKDGSKKFVSFKAAAFWLPKLVTSRQNASPFLDRNTANLGSDYFWERHWDRSTMDTREITLVKKKWSY